MSFRHLFTLVLILTASVALAQNTSLKDSIEQRKITFEHKKFYFTGDFEGALISTALSNNNVVALPAGVSLNIGTPRFSYFWNLGFNFNYDVNNAISLFTGVNIKNIGFIEKFTAIDSTVKRRVYTIGAPLGVKIGNLRNKTFFFLGGGIDVPFNYKEKGFVKRSKKDKFNEWFSDRTASFMPYVFVGGSVKPGIFLKIQYYPTNFMNPNFVGSVPDTNIPANARPYALYDVNLLLFSIGIDMRYSNKMKVKYKQDQIM